MVGYITLHFNKRKVVDVSKVSLYAPAPRKLFLLPPIITPLTVPAAHCRLYYDFQCRLYCFARYKRWKSFGKVVVV